MGLADWRSVLRGEAAPRPNPRMRVHNNSFWYHIRPRSLPEEATAWYYTAGLGWFSFFLFMVESITGLILMIFVGFKSGQFLGALSRLLAAANAH